ncbi:U32 family peptidase [Oscillatoria sp. FACHB-1407]|uniref:U32 family peptidase n=1 Tax=Oscillatoria sp. FACHB-1407 TaxID=2692847 RepID=UPI001684239F|nr:U32 family peptidase [Oscillatoria sp. FACHB-1407]MBD2461313.1 U32 family peptidase [Oscillatoria sp. FACHB-1407]
MQFNTFASSSRDLERCAHAPQLQEVLLEPALLARQGRLGEAEVQSLALEATQRGLRPVLVWDIVMTERMLSVVSDRLQRWDLRRFAAVRVSDVGAAYWLTTHAPEMPLQLIVETGNHNLEALQGWCELFGTSLERLILSIELPEKQLVEYCQSLPVACELLGVGQILLFYSPRSLLSAHISNPQEEENAPYLETTVAFEESPQRPFPTVETAHGTLMFLDKDQFILDRLEALKAAGLHTVRLDLRHLGRDGDMAIDIDRICQQILDDPVVLRKQWVRETRAPFFNANRTTSLFNRMKSKLDDYNTPQRLAEVVAAEKGQYLVFYTTQSFHVSHIKSIVLTTGEELPLPQNLVFRDIHNETVEAIAPQQLIITEWIKKVVSGSLLIGGSGE